MTNDEYFELKADYEHAINALSGEIEVFEKSMDSLDNQLARYRAMERMQNTGTGSRTDCRTDRTAH